MATAHQDIVAFHEGPVGMIDKRLAAIVRFARPLSTAQISPGLFYHVVLDPLRIEGEYIRIGDTQGDELVGWQRCDFLRICHVLAEEREGVLVNVDHGESRAIIDDLVDRLFHKHGVPK